MSKRASRDKTAVYRVKGGSAPPPLAKTRSGNRRPKPSPVTIRYADGTTETLSAKEFAARAGRPSWEEIERRFSMLLREYRQSGTKRSYAALRSFAAEHGLEKRLEAKLRHGAAGGPEPASWR